MSFKDIGSGGSPGGRKGVTFEIKNITVDTSSYAATSDAVKNLIFNISSNVTTIQKLVSQLGTPRDNRNMRARLEDLEHKTTGLIKDLTENFKHLSEFEASSDEESRIRKLEQQKLKRDFQSVLSRFQQVQRLNAEKSREFLSSAKAQAAHLEEEGEQETALLQQEQQRQLQIKKLDNEIEYNEGIIADREKSIVEIEQSIHEVNEIFRDLSTLVIEQQGMVDNIEANIESAAARTGDATIELQSASRYQKSARSKLCWLMVIFAVILLILVLVIVIPNNKI